MAEAMSKVPMRMERKAPGALTAMQGFEPLARLHREVDRLFDEIEHGFWPSFRSSMFDLTPLAGRHFAWSATLAVDVVEKDKAYEVTAELPGMDEKNIEVKLVNGSLSIKGEKQEEKEEKRKDYYLHERSFGSFERTLPMPEGVDTDKIEATFRKGVLTVTLPKKPEAIKPEKKIAVKAA